MNKHPIQYSLIAAACAALIMSACGGGGGDSASAASNTPAASTVLADSFMSGTVTGFGSIFVDGKRVDDRNVTAGKENADGSIASQELKLGQHVMVENDASLAARLIRVESQVEGAVSAVDGSAGTLTVLGQNIRINTDASLGPVTVFGDPYAKLADVALNDQVEVHGLAKTDSAGKTVIQATRIEKKVSAEASVLRGIVSSLSASAKTFKINDLVVNYGNANVTPASMTLAEGQEVAIWIPQNAVTTAPATTTTTGSTGTTTTTGTTTGTTTATASPAQVTTANATKIKIRDRKSENQSMDFQLGGAIAKLDPTAKTFVIDGISIDASSATFDQAGKTFADLKDGAYVRVKGTFQANGSLKAQTITLRTLETEGIGDVELHGTILNFKSNADFTVRDVQVDASNAKVTCGTTALANNVQVEVEGKLATGGKLAATQVKCETPQENVTIQARSGLVVKVDLVAKTLTIGSGTESVTVQWTSGTLFVNVEQAALSGKTVVIEGVVSGGVFRATKIKLVK
ncbi:DUF5666 domain-containing protein [Noviherbaspirillum galbum]|uniref:DUF5666 domain-containing protein n=1 Tax=Noviherbaspirillum galbum TaxID=2709383 RepID=A0A6B3SG42_9BURK|nr:DUF5666 domain-containing protein [Noviherbaspirillum galbum]NEX59824.1 hypothetical protein [Noviherbaspirillum galbum]